MALQLTCALSGKQFEVSDDELELRTRLNAPLPTLCPEERARRRFAFRNERNLYRKPCAYCNSPTITIYSEQSPIIVYCQDCWWSDRWSALDYGRDFDFSRPFFEQMAELMRSVPLVAL